MDAVESAFRAMGREHFLAGGDPAFDGPLAIGHGQTNSQPRAVENMLRLLEVGAGQRILDVGAGSGWTTALLAHLVGPRGEVYGVEIEPDLVGFGASNLAATHQPWASIRQAAAGVLGLPQLAPFDRILVSAVAPTLPDALVAQLGPYGRLVMPVAGQMVLAVRTDEGLEVSRHGRYSFVPLRISE